MNGFLVIDKPGGMTSRDAVNRVQRWLPRKTKIGHTGTLDPLATGVLVICIGAATRLANYVQAMKKSYVSRFRLGAVSTTDDADGDISDKPVARPPPRELIETALESLVGVVQQLPPAFSALKVHGQRAHHLARKGNDVPLVARSVSIDAIRLVEYQWPFLEAEVDCGKGTYIRSIARDLGERLGCGGLVQTLRRTRIGVFTIDQGIGVEMVPRDLKLLPMTTAIADLPRMLIDPNTERRFRSGQSITPVISPRNDGEEIVIVNQNDDLVGIGEWKEVAIKPKLVLNLTEA